MSRAVQGAAATLIAVGCFVSALGIVFVGDLGVIFLTLSFSKQKWGVDVLPVLLINAVVAVFLGSVFLRVGARAFPLRASDRLSVFALLIISVTIVAIGYVGHQLVGLFDDLDTLRVTLETRGPQDVGIVEFGMGALAFMFGKIIWLAIANVSLSLLAPLLVLWKWHTRPGAWRQSHYILFLRAFRGTSNLAALGPLLRGAAAKARLVFIAAPGMQASSWDPVSLAVGGFLVGHPLSSTPVYLRCAQTEWRSDVRALAQRASVIVIDITEGRQSVQDEIRIIDDLTTSPQMIWLTRKGTNTAIIDNQIKTRPNSLALTYEESRWKQRVVRACAFAVAYVAWALGMIVVPQILLPDLDQDVFEQAIPVLGLVACIPALLSSIALCPAIGYSRRSTAEIRSALESSLKRTMAQEVHLS